MEILAAVGPYTDAMRAAIEKSLPDGIAVRYIGGYDQYNLLKDVEYILLRTLSLTREHMQGLERAKLIQRWGAGYDTVDIQAAGERGIQVAVAAGVNAQSVAELAVALLLSLYRKLPAQVSAFAKGEDCRMTYAKDAHCIAGKTVGIIGMGNIGRTVSRIMQAFGASVVYYDVVRMGVEQEKNQNVTYLPLEEIWGRSDILSLHLPALDETKGIICQETLDKMKDGAVLINTARQELVVEKDLAVALRSGRLYGAALDGLAEPFSESQFVGLDNILCTPHIGGSTADVNVSMAEKCMENIASVQQGSRLLPPSLVNAAFLV